MVPKGGRSSSGVHPGLLSAGLVGDREEARLSSALFLGFRRIP